MDHASKASPKARQAAELMRAWDGHMEVDSVAATLAVKSRRKLWQIMLEPKLGSAWEKYVWFNSSTALENILANPNRWIAPGYNNMDAMLAAAIEQAVKDSSAPKDLSSWKWGDQLPLDIEHPLFGGIPILKKWSGTGVHPQSGNGSLTVKAAGRGFGASERMTTDLADLDSSTLNIVNGQSGQIFSPHYMDQWLAWYTGSTFVLPFSPAAVERAAEHHLSLQPI
jgi:penicillin G amidase